MVLTNFEIEKVNTPNFIKGRKGKKILAIVNHITAGLMPGTLSWMQNPAAKVSAHYLVTKTGKIYQLVDEEDTAFGAGIVNKPDWILYDGTNPNFYTLSIEHEALAGEALTDIQYQATLWLHRKIISQWGMPADHNHIIGHYRLDSVNRKNDPGPQFPWDKLMTDLKDADMPGQTINIKIGDQEIEGFILKNKAYAHARALSEAMSIDIKWDGERQSIFIYPANFTSMESDDKINIYIGSKPITGILINDKAYVPVREMAESLGRKVTWDDEGKIVTIA